MKRRRPTYVGVTRPDPMSAEELLRLSVPSGRTELVRGRLFVREPAGFVHGGVANRISVALTIHVEAHGLGRVFAAETGFKLASKPDTVRAADVSFVSNTRLPQPAPRGYAELAPDLVVEVLSPEDRRAEVEAKVTAWLNAGSRLAWTVDPMHHRARVSRADGTVTELFAGDALDGEVVVPGFRLALANVFG